MRSFWSCGFCETSNPADIATCDVCGADRPATALGDDGLIPESDLDAFVRERHTASRPIPSFAPSTALRSVTPIGRRATVAPPWVLVEYLRARRDVLHVVSAISRGLQQLLRG